MGKSSGSDRNPRKKVNNETLIRANALARRSYDEYFKISDPKKAMETLEKQYINRLNSLDGRKDEYILATEILFKKLRRKLPATTKSNRKKD